MLFTFLDIMYIKILYIEELNNRMNKLSKIFLVIIILLIIALTTVTMLYINMRENAKKNLTEFLNTAEKLYEANTKIDELEKELAK